VRWSVSGTAASALIVVMLSAIAPGFAQAPPPQAATLPLPSPGFVPPYEIMRTVRAAGFDPLAPPLREGTTYVLRATDYRGVLMRVVVDARSGAIRDANRIVPGPGAYGLTGYGPGSDGQLGMASPYESSPDIRPPPYGPPPEFDAPVMAPSGVSAMPPPVLQPPPPRRTTRATAPPLPRPRPAELAARKPAPAEISADAKSGSATAAAPAAASRKAPVAPPIND
jgi:hypothetical protein